MFVSPVPLSFRRMRATCLGQPPQQGPGIQSLPLPEPSEVPAREAGEGGGLGEPSWCGWLLSAFRFVGSGLSWSIGLVPVARKRNIVTRVVVKGHVGMLP